MSGSIFDWEPKPKEWYDSLPPLVKRGEDREAVIARIVDDWTTDLGETDPDKHIAKFKKQFGRSPVVENVAFVQESNDGTTMPIDLSEIVRAVEARLDAEGAPDEHCPTGHMLMRGCRIDACNVRGRHIRPRWSCLGMLFGDEASFDVSAFGGYTCFDGTTFGDMASFYSTTFGTEASFDSANFGDAACFVKATFDLAFFDSATFGDEVSFDGSRFGDTASFWNSTFGDGARFDSSKFGDGACFVGSTFGDWASFEGSTFGGEPEFRQVRFRGRCNVRGLAWGDRQKLMRAMLDWSRVRSLGALPVLTRISYLSLLVVPLLAGAWNAVSFYLHLDTPLSPAWAVAFFAAIFVSLGHLVYRKAPQLIREKSRDDLVAQRSANWRGAAEGQRRDLLQSACSAIQAVARLRPWDRNPNLVRRYGEVVWIPGSLEELDAVAEWENDPDPDLDEAIERASSAEGHDAIEAEREKRPRPRFTHEELRQIVIDEGAKAEFDAAAREEPGGCALSAFFYLVATILVVWLTASQIAAVLAAVFEPDRRWAQVVNLGFFWGIISIMGALLFCGAARLAWQPKRRWIRALALWPLLAAAATILILRIAANAHAPAIDRASFWLAIAAASVIITTGITGCIEWVRHQLKAPEPTG